MVNGDTIFKINVADVFSFHIEKEAESTLSLKPMQRFDRYGVVELTDKAAVKEFKEKQYYESGLINGGVYVLNVEKFLAKKFPSTFSFEKDYLEQYYGQGQIYGIVQDKYFIDIGIPEDFKRVQEELKQPPFDVHLIDKSWTLFSDRDGVLNEDKVGSYIFHPGEYVFYEGVPEAFKLFGERFGHIIIATNQRGVGRGLMTIEDLDAVHEKMLAGIEEKGGKIDAIFYATSIDNDDPVRKPNVGMVLKPRNNFLRSICQGPL